MKENPRKIAQKTEEKTWMKSLTIAIYNLGSLYLVLTNSDYYSTINY